MTVREEACTSGRDPGPHLTQPWVVETSTTVTVYWATQYEQGTYQCPASPAATVTLELGAPLGDRDLLDGSSFPPVQVLPVR